MTAPLPRGSSGPTGAGTPAAEPGPTDAPDLDDPGSRVPARNVRAGRSRIPPSVPVALALLVAFWLGGFLGVNLRGSQSPAGAAVRRIFPQVGQGVDSATVEQAWDTVKSRYWRTDVSGGQGTQAAVSGIVEQLRTQYGDRFSAFYTSDQYGQLQDSLNGRHAGSIGIELQARCDGGASCQNGARPTLVAITGVLRNQPAEKAGIRRGDILTRIDGTALSSLGPDPDTQINAGGDRIRGNAGTTVTLTVQSGAQTHDVVVTRADLQVPSVYAQRFGATVDVQVTAFDQNTGDDVQRTLREALAAGATSVVLDLRHNPGGFVQEAQKAASQFLTRAGAEQDVVVRRGRINGTATASADTVEHDQITDGGVAPKARLAVLVDADSASAAEIVAAALHDYRRGVVVGEKTFGKGSVQEDFGLPDGSDLHLTVEKWFGPSGESIDGTGITPDTAVAMPAADDRFRLDAEAADPGLDPQLQAALQAVGQ